MQGYQGCVASESIHYWDVSVTNGRVILRLRRLAFCEALLFSGGIIGAVKGHET